MITVEAILEATAQILLTDGADRLSTNRIAKRAGVSIGSLYQYFSSKEEIVVALAEHHLAEERDLVLSILGELDGGDLLEITRRLIKGVFAAHQHHPELHRVLVRLMPDESLAAVKRTVADVLTVYMTRDQDQLRIRDPVLAAFVVVEMVDSAIQSATLSRPEFLADDRLVDELVDAVQRYVMP